MEIIISSKGFLGKSKYAIGANIIDLLKETPKKILVISTAIKAYPIFWRFYLSNYIKSLKEIFDDVEPEIIDIKYFEDSYISKINEADLIVVVGGNTYLLAKHLQANGMLYETLKNKKNGIYVGDSAGAIIIGENIDTAAFTSPFGIADLNIYSIKNKEGLCLIPYSIWPDFDIKNYKKMEKRFTYRFTNNRFRKLFRVGVNEAFYFNKEKLELEVM